MIRTLGANSARNNRAKRGSLKEKFFMARYQHLSIYKSCYSLSREIYRIKMKLPKNLKHDIGSMMFNSSLRCVRCVVFANGSHKKLRPLQELLLEIELLWSLMRLLYDLRGISRGEFQVLSEKLTEVGPQANAWLKWEKSNLRSKTEKEKEPVIEK